jgi:hypothetical protein
MRKGYPNSLVEGPEEEPMPQHRTGGGKHEILKRKRDHDDDLRQLETRQLGAQRGGKTRTGTVSGASASCTLMRLVGAVLVGSPTTPNR